MIQCRVVSNDAEVTEEADGVSFFVRWVYLSMPSVLSIFKYSNIQIFIGWATKLKKQLSLNIPAPWVVHVGERCIYENHSNGAEILVPASFNIHDGPIRATLFV